MALDSPTQAEDKRETTTGKGESASRQEKMRTPSAKSKSRKVIVISP